MQAAPSRNGAGRRPYPAARYPVASAVIATAPYPAASLRPVARPRRAGPTRSIFMITVVDQVKPWFRPSRTLAATTQAQLGAQIRRSGTGRPTSQPVTRTGLPPHRAARPPAGGLAKAFVTPNAKRNVRMLTALSIPKTFDASSGTTVRSWPTMPPTRALTATRRANWPAFSRRPRRIGRRSAPVDRVTGRRLVVG